MWIAIKLFLGGLLGPILDFVKKNWKLVAIVATIIFAYFAINNYIGNIKTEYYNKGVTAERTVWNNKINKENIANRRFETKLKEIIEEFGEKTVKQSIERINRETIYIDKIKTIISNNPVYKQCLIEQDLLNARNKIRAEGPTGVKSSSITENGTVVMEFSK